MWQPIETAPKDAGLLMFAVIHPDWDYSDPDAMADYQHDISIGWFDSKSGKWFAWLGTGPDDPVMGFPKLEATHWQPLPPPNSS